jgi:hypothetical protein
VAGWYLTSCSRVGLRSLQLSTPFNQMLTGFYTAADVRVADVAGTFAPT